MKVLIAKRRSGEAMCVGVLAVRASPNSELDFPFVCFLGALFLNTCEHLDAAVRRRGRVGRAPRVGMQRAASASGKPADSASQATQSGSMVISWSAKPSW